MKHVYSGGSLDDDSNLDGLIFKSKLNGEIDLDAASDETDSSLPPWTAPPTGEIPKIFNFNRDTELRVDLEKTDSGALSWAREARHLDKGFKHANVSIEEAQHGSQGSFDDWSDDNDSDLLRGTYSSHGSNEHQYEKLNTQPVRSVSSRTNPLLTFRDRDRGVRSREAARVTAISEKDGEELSQDVTGPKHRKVGSKPKRRRTSPYKTGSGPVNNSGGDSPKHFRTSNSKQKSGIKKSWIDISEFYRVSTGIALGAATIVIFLIGQAAFIPYLLIMMVLAVVEFYEMIGRKPEGDTKPHIRPYRLVGFIGTIGVVVGAYEKGATAITFALGFTILVSMIWYLAGIMKTGGLSNVGMTLLPVMWIGVGGAFAALIVRPINGDPRRGMAYMMAIILTTVAADVFAYLGGSLFGHRLLAPSVSPRKTLEGALFGALGAILTGSLLASHIHPVTVSVGGALGVIAAIAGPCGDLIESQVKREMGVKDSGFILPGHGGMLDRIDALIFVTPFSYYFLYFGHHI